MEKLKPCPLCGGEASQISQGGRKGMFGWIECDSCGTRTRAISLYGDRDKDEDFYEQFNYDILASIWNRRVKDDSGKHENDAC